MESKYVWASGSYHKAKADIAAKVVTGLADEGGYTKPEAVVEVSRPDEAPLHVEFEWDDEQAANAYRTDQARRLISHICIVNVSNTPIEQTRAFVHIKNDEQSGYKSIETVLLDAKDNEYLLKAALSELNSFQRKYQSLRELDAVMKEISKL